MSHINVNNNMDMDPLYKVNVPVSPKPNYGSHSKLARLVAQNSSPNLIKMTSPKKKKIVVCGKVLE